MFANFKKYLLVVMIAFSPVIISGCATGDSVISPAFYDLQPDRIAIVDVTGDVRGSTAKNQISSYFAAELMKKGYRVIERERVDSVLKEQDFQRSDVTSSDEAAELGEVLNVPAVAMLDVTVSGEKLSMTGRIVATETGEVLWIGSGRGGTGQTLATLLGAGAGVAAGSQVGGGSGRTAAMIGGGVIGAVAGSELAPQVARMVERAIQRMSRDLPER